MNAEAAKLTILPARGSDDIAAAARLFRAYEASLEIDLGYQGFEAELSQLPGDYAPPAGELLLARTMKGQPVGCVALRPHLRPGCSEMKRLYVDPLGRGLGTGRALMDAAIAVARAIGYRELLLDTLPTMAAAQGLYRSAGFEPMRAYYETPVEGTLFMRLKLG